jgi:hypothetical protein
LNFQAKPESFPDDAAKVNYVFSFLKGTALNYFEPLLTNDLANEPSWLTDFDYFTMELYIYFGPYDQEAKAEVELEQIIMKNNYKATKFFIEFYKLSILLNHKDLTLYRMAYNAMLGRVKDKLVHFNKPEA